MKTEPMSEAQLAEIKYVLASAEQMNADMPELAEDSRTIIIKYRDIRPDVAALVAEVERLTDEIAGLLGECDSSDEGGPDE